MKRSGEQLSGNLESKKHGDRYEVFRRYAKMVNAIMEHCIEIKGRTFEDVEDMEDATYTIASRWGDELQSYQKSAGDIPIRASGEGIHVPHVNLQSITGEECCIRCQCSRTRPAISRRCWQNLNMMKK
jgi:hypothetical protein